MRARECAQKVPILISPSLHIYDSFIYDSFTNESLYIRLFYNIYAIALKLYTYMIALQTSRFTDEGAAVRAENTDLGQPLPADTTVVQRHV